MSQIISRSEAKQQGLTHYYTGKPCPHGHIASRRTGPGDCYECATTRVRRWRETNTEKSREASKRWQTKNAEVKRENDRRWAQANPDRVRARTARRGASKLQRTPKWLTEVDYFVMEEMYRLAKERSEVTGTKHHVDHIIPLRGEKVSGLHVPSNLRVIPANENLTKHNKFEPEERQ